MEIQVETNVLRAALDVENCRERPMSGRWASLSSVPSTASKNRRATPSPASIKYHLTWVRDVGFEPRRLSAARLIRAFHG